MNETPGRDDTDRHDLLALLAQDHHDVEDLLTALERTGPDEAPRRKELAERAAALLASHADSEAHFLLPTLRMHVPQGDQLADREIRGHAGIDLLIKTLDGSGPKDEDYGPTILHLIGTTRAHFAEEETLLFPKLAANCTREQLAVLGAMASAARSES